MTPPAGSPTCLRFTGPWRFESYDHGLSNWYGGDYADVTASNGDGATGTLSFTWDPNNDPDEPSSLLR